MQDGTGCAHLEAMRRNRRGERENLIAAGILSGLLGLAAVSPPAARAAEAGAWETFFTEPNAEAWSVYDYNDDGVYFADWFGTSPGDEYIYFFYEGDWPIWFYIDEGGNAGDGALIGNYKAEDIQAIRVDVYINSLTTFGLVDCAVLATGSAGRRYYFSSDFSSQDFSGPGWWTVRFDLNDTWFYDNGTNFVPVAVTDGMRSTVEEVGFRFFPKLGAVNAGYAAIDDVRLEPRVVAPELAVSATAAEFRMAFTPAKANFCVIEKWNPDAEPAWSDVAGQSYVTGPAEHVFTTPLAGRGIFRVSSFADYVPFLTTP